MSSIVPRGPPGSKVGNAEKPDRIAKCWHLAAGVLLCRNYADTANWTVNDSGSDFVAHFFYDYAAIGVPAAPNGTGTRGLKMTANNSSGVFSLLVAPGHD
jgi:hypothetical protein